MDLNSPIMETRNVSWAFQKMCINPAVNLSYHDFTREVSVLDCSSNLR